MTYYEKRGRKYFPIEYYPEGLPEGLWLILKDKYSTSNKNMLLATKVHSIQDAGKFSDVLKKISKPIEEFVSKNGHKYSLNDILNEVASILSK